MKPSHNPAPRTLAQVSAALAKAAKKSADKSMANLMLNHGNLTAEARQYVADYVKG